MRPKKIESIAEMEGKTVSELLISTYERFGSQTETAASLGISQGRLSQLLKEYRLKEKRILVREQAS